MQKPSCNVSLLIDDSMAWILINSDCFFGDWRKDGYLFDKESILQYIISKKAEYAKKMKEYERQKQIEDNESNELDALEEQKKLIKFLNTEKNIVTAGSSKGVYLNFIFRFRHRDLWKMFQKLISNYIYCFRRSQHIVHLEYGQRQREESAQFLGAFSNARRQSLEGSQTRPHHPLSSVTEANEGQRSHWCEIHTGEWPRRQEVIDCQGEPIHVRRHSWYSQQFNPLCCVATNVSTAQSITKL